MKRTYQPSKIRRIRSVGFRSRLETVGGRKVLKRRRAKGRHNLSASEAFGTGVVKAKKRRYS